MLSAKNILAVKRFLLSCLIGFPIAYAIYWVSKGNVIVCALTVPTVSVFLINPLMRKLIR